MNKITDKLAAEGLVSSPQPQILGYRAPITAAPYCLVCVKVHRPWKSDYDPAPVYDPHETCINCGESLRAEVSSPANQLLCLKVLNSGTGSTNCQLFEGHGGYCSEHPIAMRERTDRRENLDRMMDLKPIKAREAAATKGPWQAMKAGNCTMENGLLAHISEVTGLPRPWEPTWVGWKSAKNYFKTFMRDEDADFVAYARRDIPALIAEIERLRAEVSSPASQWQPIETAPRDGTEVLLAWVDPDIPEASKFYHVGYNLGDGRRWQDTHNWLHNERSWPTHWMPLSPFVHGAEVSSTARQIRPDLLSQIADRNFYGVMDAEDQAEWRGCEIDRVPRQTVIDSVPPEGDGIFFCCQWNSREPCPGCASLMKSIQRYAIRCMEELLAEGAASAPTPALEQK